MKVELSIADDKELRDMIKDMIRGQIVSVAREEIREILKEVFNSKYTLDAEKAQKFIEDEAKKYVRDQIHSVFYNDGYSQSRELMRTYAQSEINKRVKEMFENGRIV